MRQAFLSHVAIDGDSETAFEALLAAALVAARERRLAWVLAGFAARHPLLPVARARRRARAYESVLHVVEWKGRPALFDDRIPHPEVALL
jgi:hypothetical protein